MKDEMRKRGGAVRTGKSLHEHLFRRDAGGPVPPAGGFAKGGLATGGCAKRASGGDTGAARLTRGESVGGRTGGDNPSHDLTRGKSTCAAKGGAMRRAMGGVGKLRLGQMS